jgi:dTDP-4-amino-4,6-dideoxygalactose transaminase
VFGDGLQLRDFNYVDDAVDAFLAAALDPKAQGEVFNLGGHEPINLKTLADLMIGLHGGGRYEIIPFPPERKAIDIGDYYSDYQKTSGALGWRPRVGLTEGLSAASTTIANTALSTNENSMVLMNDFKAEPEELIRKQAAAAERVIRSGWYILGKELQAFETRCAERCGIAHALGVGNGMDALEIGMTALGIGPGDEVITTPMTAFASTLAILRAGATPVFADIDPGTAILDPVSAARCVTPRTKAVLLAQLYGRCADMDVWTAFCRDRNLILVEDCAQAHLSEWKGRKAGTFGPFGAFSFYPTKNLGAIGDGGMIITGDAKLAEKVKRLRNYGQSQRYHHPEKGLNSRLDEIQAAILSERLEWLEPYTKRRRGIAEAYFAGIKNPAIHLLDRPAAPEASVHHLFVLLTDRRDELGAFLKSRNVDNLIHYPVSVHRQEPCLQLSRDPEGLPNSEAHADRCLSIPCHPQMTDGDVRTILDAVNEFR